MSEMKFKVGDVVYAYDIYGGKRGEVVNTSKDRELFQIEFTQDADLSWFHHKACRKVVVKERRRVWVKFDQYDFPTGVLNEVLDKKHSPYDWIEFMEVKKK